MLNSHFRVRVISIGFILFFMSCAVLRVAAGDSDSTVPAYSPPRKGFWKSLYDLFSLHYESSNVIFSKETAYHNVTVEDDESGKRHLVFKPNHGSQGTILPNTPDALVPNFMKYSILALPALRHPPKSVLFIGLGAGILPRFIAKRYPSTGIDIVEIDEALKPIAEKFFGFKTTKNMTLTFEDGRFFINHCRRQYDLIVLDAYTAVDIPFQFTTVEFFRNVRRSLTDGGLLAANLANLGRPVFLASEFKTVKSVFKNVAVVVCPGKTNYVLFASKKDLFRGEAWRNECENMDDRMDFGFRLAPFLHSRLSDDEIDVFSAAARILTDDFAPVNTLE